MYKWVAVEKIWLTKRNRNVEEYFIIDYLKLIGSKLLK